MAKKKSKKNSQLSTLLLFVAAVLAIVVFVTMFLNAVVYKAENTDPSYYTGSVIAFGKKLGEIKILGVSAESKIEFNFVLAIAYLLPLVVACVAVVFSLVNKKAKGLKLIVGVLLAASFIAALVIFIKAADLATLTYIGSLTGTTKTALSELGYKLAYGSYIGMGACGVGAIAALGYALA